jgi:hypothetical protein
MARIAAAIVAIAALAAAGVAGRAAVAASFAARRLARALPDAHLQLIEGAGHHLPRRAPDAVADAIAAFLAVTEEADHRVERRSRTFGGRRRIKAAVVLADPLALAGIADAYRGCG